MPTVENIKNTFLKEPNHNLASDIHWLVDQLIGKFIKQFLYI